MPVVSIYHCHECQKNIAPGMEFFYLEVRAVDSTCGDDSCEQDEAWVLCSKGCVRKALPRIEPLKMFAPKKV